MAAEKLYELNHHRVETNMCFATSESRTQIKSPQIIQLTQFDAMFIALPALEASKERGKISVDDIELERPEMRCLLNKVTWEAFCSTSTVDETLYVKLDHDKLNAELARRHANLLEIMSKSDHMADLSIGKLIIFKNLIN